MAEGHTLTTTGSGVRVVTETVPAVRSAALGFFVGTGSSTEDEPVAGWSHLLEHLLFRGTDRYGSAEIDELFDGMGAELNAGTGKESTSVYTRVLDGHLERAFDAMADMVWRPALRAEDVAAEQEIVVEEIAMYEDDPQDVVFDLLSEAVFGAHPLGRPVIGTRASVTAASADGLGRFHAERYAPGDLVVAAAGSVDHARLVALVRAAEPSPPVARTRAPQAPAAPEAVPARRTRFARRETEQYHLTLGGLGLARDDERRHALRVLDTILGGTSSSRLFQEVRERRALAYAVSSFHTQHAGTGQIGIYLGTRADNVRVALEVVAQVLGDLRREGISDAELERAKEHAKGRLVLALESMSARMSRLGGSVLAGLPVLGVDELIARTEAVGADDVHALAAELLAPGRLVVAGVGPDEAVFRSGAAAIVAQAAEVAA